MDPRHGGLRGERGPVAAHRPVEAVGGPSRNTRLCRTRTSIGPPTWWRHRKRSAELSVERSGHPGVTPTRDDADATRWKIRLPLCSELDERAIVQGVLGCVQHGPAGASVLPRASVKNARCVSMTSAPGCGHSSVSPLLELAHPIGELEPQRVEQFRLNNETLQSLRSPSVNPAARRKAGGSHD
jgi:hypothetical protein